MNIIEYIKNNTLRLEASRRGGGIEIDLSNLFPEIVDLGFEPKMSAYQNYLGGGLLGAVKSGYNFNFNDLTSENQALFCELEHELKRYFFDITNEEATEYDEWNNQSYEVNQKMPTSAY